MKNKYALLSVSDKTGIKELAENLIEAGYSIISTGGTAKRLKESGIAPIEVKDFARFPEIFNGRVKTLQPEIFGGILMRRDSEKDFSEAEKNNISAIDVVCVNLYPFPEVVKKSDATLQDKIENIDIGGPSLIRAAAKNYQFVSVLTSPEQYNEFAEKLASGNLSLDFREKLAAEAFAHTAKYDAVIADFFEENFLGEKKNLRLNFPLTRKLRYGENPHQDAYIYGDFENYFEILHGKELSYNNIIDLIAAVNLSEELGENAVAIIKHTNPAGAALRNTVFESYLAALSGDPVSSFGGIVSVNGTVDAETAEKLNEIFLEIIVAKDFTEPALQILRKKKNRRLLKLLGLPPVEKTFRSIPGGILVQDYDGSDANRIEFRQVSNILPKKSYINDLKFAWIIGKHVKSNAIAITKDMKILGIGAGQMSRVDSAKIAVSKAKEHGHDLSDSVASSDAFFPFPDGLEVLADAGVKFIVEPGGSKRDEEVINAANERGVALYFTGIRNFKH